MSDITPASTNLLYHGDINFKNPTPVIELYPRAYGQQDEFVPANTQDGGKGRKPSFMGSFLKYLAITGAVVFAGRKGLFGSKIRGWLGGGVKALKPEEIFSRIETKMAEFLGRDGDVVTSSKIIKATDGSSMLRAEFQSGAVREYKVKEGGNVIKLCCDNAGEITRPLKKILGKSAGKDKYKLEQYVLFDKADGAVKFRTDLARGAKGKVKAYASYKGESVLNPDFNEYTGVFKDYFNRKLSILGTRFEKARVRLFNNPRTGEPSVIKSKRIFRKDIPKRHIRDEFGNIRKFIYNRAGKLDAMEDAHKIVKYNYDGAGKLINAVVTPKS